MSLLQAIVMGIVQGLTEFLPISSTAHLRIVPALACWPDAGAAFSAVIQCGTLIAVLAYFRRDIWAISKAWLSETFLGEFGQSREGRLGWLIILGTIPIVILGLAFQKHIKTELRSLYVIAGALIAFSLVMAVAELLAARRKRLCIPERTIDDVHSGDAITVGMAQAIALLPGASRSGMTITAGLFRGLSRETAARFSFLLSLPAIFAAAVKELIDERSSLLASRSDILNLLVSTAVSGIVGYATIAFLLGYLKRHTTYLFIIYRLAFGALLFWLVARGLVPATDPNTADTALNRPTESRIMENT